MALTEGDKAECKEIARVIVKEVLVEHVAACPHGLLLMRKKAVFIGICIGVSIGSGVGSTGIMMLLIKAFGS